MCARCQHRRNRYQRTALCRSCYSAVRHECQQAQERDYLINYLFDHHHEPTAQICRLQAEALRLGLTYAQPVPPTTFVRRMAEALARYRLE
jgi:hypothetical protein